MADKLTLTDIADLRAYERERTGFRSRVIALKKRRRVHVGPIITLVFENRDTIRFQIQEMARVEKLLTDDSIQDELDTYNTLIPGAGQLCATLFLELTEEAQMRTWLPKLVSIEGSVALQVGEDDAAVVLRAQPEAAHAELLTREETTASVHYLWWDLTPEEVALVEAGPVRIVIDHPEYQHQTQLHDETLAELHSDLRG
ncbi:MAG: DUF3501 family protein [Acidimicrobiales bacterium]